MAMHEPNKNEPNKNNDVAKCKYCNNRIKFAEPGWPINKKSGWFHTGTTIPTWHCINKHGKLVDIKPSNTWLLVGILGPRVDGRRYYIYRNYATQEIYYKWDRDFWYPTDVFEKMSKVRPAYELSSNYNKNPHFASNMYGDMKYGA